MKNFDQRKQNKWKTTLKWTYKEYNKSARVKRDNKQSPFAFYHVQTISYLIYPFEFVLAPWLGNEISRDQLGNYPNDKAALFLY